MLTAIGHKGIVKNMPFLLYCAFMGIIYISMNHYAENTIRDINRKSRVLKEARWKYIDLQTQIMFLTKESELAKPAAALGLEKTKVPPHKINIVVEGEDESK